MCVGGGASPLAPFTDAHVESYFFMVKNVTPMLSHYPDPSSKEFTLPNQGGMSVKVKNQINLWNLEFLHNFKSIFQVEIESFRRCDSLPRTRSPSLYHSEGVRHFEDLGGSDFRRKRNFQF